ncbi:MAG: CAAD domain-containing protein, partial [Cyanobacteriota bacterium]|nr:CAAD domain-containing protein [Cyanobacteriota bacterium]
LGTSSSKGSGSNSLREYFKRLIFPEANIMTDSSKSKKPTSKTSGLVFQKNDDQTDAKASSPSETSPKPTEPKQPEPEVPTESISISLDTSEPAKAEAQPVVAPSPKAPEPKPEPAKAETEPVVAPSAKTPEPEPAPKITTDPPMMEPPKPEPESSAPKITTDPPMMEPPKPEPESSAPKITTDPPMIKPPEIAKPEPTTTQPVPTMIQEPETIESSELDLQSIKDKVLKVISDLPENFSNFFGEYQRPLWTVVGIILIIVTMKALVGVLDSINDIPFVKFTLELVGMGYTGWFVYRYLLRSETRQELLANLQSYKDEVVGKDS